MKRELGPFHLTALGVNAIIGSGIFMMPGLLAKYLGGWSVIAFPLCGLLLNLVALAFARLATTTSRNGGLYLYAALAFGPLAAFIVGWTAWICALVSCGAVGSAIGFYLGHFLPARFLSPLMTRGLAGGSILLFGAVNYFGVRYGGRLMTGLTVLKVALLCSLAAAGLFYLRLQPLAFPAWHSTRAHFAEALAMALFICQGFEAVPIIAGETRHATRTIPLAILWSLWISVALYTVIQLGIVSGPAVGSLKPLADQAKFIWGSAGGDLVAVAGLISVIGFVAGIVLSAPRLLSPLCDDGLLPRMLSHRHPRFGTETGAILLTTAGSFFFTVSNHFENLVVLSALSVAMQYLVASLAVLALARQARSREERRGGAWIGSGALAVSVFFLAQIPRNAWITFAWVTCLGVLFHFVYTHLERRELANNVA